MYKRQPVIYSNYSMAGASTPLTPAGTLALLLAELLAGLTISQLIRPGAAISLGMLPVYFDMKTMMNFYDPQSVLINLACAEMMAHYGLPHTCLLYTSRFHGLKRSNPQIGQINKERIAVL